MARIEDSIEFIFQNEGGFTIDDGGPTNWGIVKRDVAEYRGILVSEVSTQEMQDLSKDEATKIYKQQYWDKLRLDDVQDLGVATCIFDTGVNRGISIGAKYAQKVCVALGAALVVDGQIGGMTIAAINKCSRADFIRHYEAMVYAGYTAILEGRPSFGIYAKGWYRRAARLLTLI